MEKFKHAMGFPMLATALWLLSQTSNHFGDRGPLWVGLFLVLLAFAAWIWGEFIQRSSRKPGLAIAACLLLLGFGYSYCLEKELSWRAPEAAVAKVTNHPTTAGMIAWQPWSQAAVEKARAEGHPVLVDFTANWCLTCQANKRTSIEIESVRSKLRETNTVALLGDFTREDPAIAGELKRFNRAGVPLVIVYPKDPGREPIILPTLLTPGIVLSALDEAVK
jgi:thiol:disulfide interchange protein DsbD